jgi:divinyl chlorophyllide a 8-vinyl-reductase
VQEPELEFQRAKLAFEAELQGAPLDWTIVRPTAYFKSLSGQIDRVKAGRPFLVFGDGKLTACKPISDGDLARFIVQSLTDPAASRRILPIGGPGPAITPLDQAAMLSDLLGRKVPVRRVPVAMMTGIVGVLATLGLASQRMADKAEFARIGRFYATRSMLVRDPSRGAYEAAATPEFGTETLRDHYATRLTGELSDDRGAHAVF